ncbi:hypothetical protein PHLGIDRAFT_96364 [Phlebiopsis gigantea 11061_1 CR5-6]|uniref:Uncharacterized protein n=1 Tax=Phlebiopsis gigantea (strain 11061_1 CR5-6) TaxID=745531 RepID=A0A0C3RQI5_PHLG1|nr:hypothetical protein PHLGIDRAFT_96364 [Phlebiopsis gigantea 11061_1 CR5-6]
MSKRKAQVPRDNITRVRNPPPRSSDPDASLFIQAHEADIIRGPRGHAASLALETRTVDGQVVGGEALMRWGGESEAKNGDDGDGFVDVQISLDLQRNKANAEYDRYDARLLLDAWETQPSVPPPDCMSPTGWSDLPSDTEDMFFLSPDEIEDYHRDKRRRMIERGREERLKAMKTEEDENEEREGDEWGGSDEEPDDDQKELMRRTAQHILSSPNPAQLEMRILANHGADKRFAFLRGRWSRAWKTAKGRVRLEQDEKHRKTGRDMIGAGLGGLSGYGDSEDDSDADDDPGGGEGLNDVKDQEQHSVHIDHANSGTTTQDDAVKEARRARAREWAEKRRARQMGQPDENI